ncbi:MAG TPA: primosomal protein N' [Parvularcula sp.]|nr:primosomal protein N' [Parvularcula sp.]
MQPKPAEGSRLNPERPADEATDSAASAGAIVKVLFPLPLLKAYDYRAPAPLPPGTFVEAPFGGRIVLGVVWPGEADGLDAGRIRPINRALGAPPLGARVIDFVGWVAAYTMFPLGAVLRLVIRSGDALYPPKGVAAYEIAGAAPARMTPERRAVLDAIKARSGALNAQEILEASSAGAGVVAGLVRAGALRKIEIDPDPPFAPPDARREGKALTAEQHRAAVELVAATARAGVTLLDGVTGSGKTEVYLEAAAEVLKRQPEAQVLILLPEIALTLPFLRRVEARFGAEPAAWHSDLSPAARRRVWRRVNDGSARLVIGARSALFLPYRELQLIIVDEEHDGAYKQDEGVIYQARDMAVARGVRGGFPVILASATPSLETVVNVEQARYGLVRLPARYGRAALPKIALVDLRADPPEQGRWLSPPLIGAVDARLKSGEQSLLFINRRGYAPLTICRRCGHRMKSPYADTFLVEHRYENKLVCHLTGYSTPKPAACPECKAVGSLAPCGPGVERIAEEAGALWPAARRRVLSSDLVQSPRDMRALLDDMESGGVDILIATQMIAKGHHFPRLTLVGVVDADMGLAGGDLRAAERTYQLLSQVSGRAGRAERPGEALIQTWQPHAPVFAALAAGDRDGFLEAEAAGRAELGFPPFGRLAALQLRSANEAALKVAGAAHREALFSADGVTVWGPAPAAVYRVRGEARLRFLVKARRDVNVQAFLNEWLGRVRLPGSVRRTIDIDPYAFM